MMAKHFSRHEMLQRIGGIIAADSTHVFRSLLRGNAKFIGWRTAQYLFQSWNSIAK